MRLVPVRSLANITPSNATATTDAELATACRDMLRHARHPARLRANPIVRRVAEREGLSLQAVSDDELVRHVERTIEAALQALPPRQRSIVQRCDLGGERYEDVARELFISKRHAFRERDTAAASIVAGVLAVPQLGPAIVTPRTDLLAARVRQARTLDQNGHGSVATSLLADAAATISDPGGRNALTTRLIHLSIDAGRLADADRDLLAARGTLASDPSLLPWHHAEFDVAAARLGHARGHIDEAARLAQRASASLRSALETSGEPRIGNALTGALLLRAQIAHGAGELSTAVLLGSAARDIGKLTHQRVDVELAVEARLAHAMLQMYATDDAKHSGNIEEELFACYAQANDGGMTRLAIRIMTHLSILYRLMGRPELSVATLTPLTSTARLVGTRNDTAAFFHEIASAQLEIGAPGKAEPYVGDLRVHAAGIAEMEPWAEHLIARLFLAEHKYPDALSAARQAEIGFARLGQERYVGTALRFQAEALARLGDTRLAIETAQRSIAILASRSAPVRLAEAHRLLGALTGNAAHVREALRLFRSAQLLASSNARASRAI
jgi:tetratricopeptide (TPR) repeat protein